MKVLTFLMISVLVVGCGKSKSSKKTPSASQSQSSAKGSEVSLSESVFCKEGTPRNLSLQGSWSSYVPGNNVMLKLKFNANKKLDISFGCNGSKGFTFKNASSSYESKDNGVTFGSNDAIKIETDTNECELGNLAGHFDYKFQGDCLLIVTNEGTEYFLRE